MFRTGFDEEEEEQNYCKQNRWRSYDCTLCKINVPSVTAYEKHTQTEIHKKAVRVDVEWKKHVKSFDSEPVIFLSTFEHNSNLLPWRETGAHIEMVPITEEGDFDYEWLATKLKSYSQNCLKIGAFSAGSNVTGHLNDVDRIAMICHSNGALACFDYAAVAPYVDINMNAPTGERPSSWKDLASYGDTELAYKDAIFISPHKIVGGPGASGVLISKKVLLKERIPYRPGGGTVAFVNELDTDYVPDI